MIFPFTAFVLATEGEMKIGRDSYLRLFLVHEKEANGVGFEWQRELFQPDNCLRTSVGYLLWEGRGESSSYCQCFDAVTQAPLPAGATCEF